MQEMHWVGSSSTEISWSAFDSATSTTCAALAGKHTDYHVGFPVDPAA